MAGRLTITAVPPGEAPQWVREAWVGLSLPLAQPPGARTYALTSGVVSGPKTWLARVRALVTGQLSPKAGYRVEVPAAIAVLAERHPRAAAWWRENTPHLVQPRKYFIFPDGVGRVTEDAKA